MMQDVQPQASHFIDGKYAEDTSGRLIECVYPATGQIVPPLPSSTPATL